MKPSKAIKPISYLKSNTADVVRTVNECREPMIITQNGEAKAVVQDMASYEQTQETLALLKLLAQGQKDLQENRSRPMRGVIRAIRKELLE